MAWAGTELSVGESSAGGPMSSRFFAANVLQMNTVLLWLRATVLQTAENFTGNSRLEVLSHYPLFSLLPPDL